VSKGRKQDISEDTSHSRKRGSSLHWRQLGQAQLFMAMWDPQTKRSRFIGYFASEEDAARAYDCAAVQARGPGVKRNFPGEAISELPATVGEERKQQEEEGRVCYRGDGYDWKRTQRWSVSSEVGHVRTSYNCA
jgi:hypothetical protein